MAFNDDRFRQVRLKVWGEYACFTRPEMKVERVSYDVMTPAAARGILEAILWKKAIRWIVRRIDVLRPVALGRVVQHEEDLDRLETLSQNDPIRFTSVRRNEVACTFSSNSGFFVEENRQQRAGLILKDVAYTIHAEFALTPQAGPEDTVEKFSNMFRRRASKGQCFHHPYLGCREFAAHFSLVDFDQELPEPIPETRDFGFMFHDFDYDRQCRARFFRAQMIDGSITVPSLESEEVRS